MAFNYRDTLTESDLVYPNLVSANIKTNNPKSSSSTSLPPPPQSSSSVLKNVQDIIDKPKLIPYKFTVEREVLERARIREEEMRKKKELNDGDNNNANESIEITLLYQRTKRKEQSRS